MPVGTLRRWIAFWYNLPARVATRIWVGGEVNYAMKYNFEVLSRQYAVVALFVRHLAYARGLKAATENLKDHGEFWGSTASAHLELAVVEWCKVFGSDGEKTHWKNIFAEGAEEQAIEEFRRRILSKTSLAEKQWKAYHKTMLGLRNKFVAHLDLSMPFNEPTPIFDTALRVACAYQEWVKWLIRASVGRFTPVIWEDPAFISRYEEWKAEASSIVSLLAKT